MQLCFDFDRVEAVPVVPPGQRSSVPPRKVSSSRRARGKTAYDAGRIAEGTVSDRYLRRGYDLIQTRWRGKSGEVDLILRKDSTYIFVEVKASKDFSRAAARINRAQMNRICHAAIEFCGGLPSGLQTDMRLDAALVDQFGRVEIIENAFGMD
ncbi:hypothetical protein FQV27_09700 [Paracoccus aurantiacus]|uniref:Uncharacterized protein n=1 Tax=Paracoccus aurantiacus TaxID=2599412 RepID=A0A5C6S444_9RHOB|nr:YraN family protein [Paracoccus aurantiacus]TXB69229.1 hypothetical protein FQV27_09700 [Paracoccus aurantiacus]